MGGGLSRFKLQPVAGADAIEWIGRAFGDDSALLKHELAYCLGQMQDPQAIPTLSAVLRDTQQEPMVRHEAGKPSRAAQSGVHWWVCVKAASANGFESLSFCRRGSGSDRRPRGPGPTQRLQPGPCD